MPKMTLREHCEQIYRNDLQMSGKFAIDELHKHTNEPIIYSIDESINTIIGFPDDSELVAVKFAEEFGFLTKEIRRIEDSALAEKAEELATDGFFEDALYICKRSWKDEDELDENEKELLPYIREAMRVAVNFAMNTFNNDLLEDCENNLSDFHECFDFYTRELGINDKDILRSIELALSAGLFYGRQGAGAKLANRVASDALAKLGKGEEFNLYDKVKELCLEDNKMRN